jgi:hypothetical protein
LYRFDLEDGGSVVVEAEPDPGVVRASRATAVIREATQSFENALVGARDAASAALKQFTSMVQQPTAVEITFGVYLDAKAGAIIAQAGAQGHFEVKLKWQREAEQDA